MSKSSMPSEHCEATPAKKARILDNYGIETRVNETFKRFTGLVKQSAGDFIVNEIDKHGNVLHLTNFDIPVVPEAAPAPLPDRQVAENRMREILGCDVFETLLAALERNDKNEKIQVKAPEVKTERKELHDFVKHFYKQYNTNTTSLDGVQMLDVNHQFSSRRVARDGYESQARSKEEFKICEAVMYKDSIDTLQAVSLIANGLKINQKRIGYAGTKDKRAKTTQMLTFFCIGVKQIVGLNKNFHNVKLGNFRLRHGDALRLGDLSGNRFKLVIRQVSETDNEIISSGVESLKTRGFYNYFGRQRFGSCAEAPTHAVGKFLILNNVKEAVELILKPRTSGKEREEVQFARHLWSSQPEKAHQAYALIERINCVEKFLLEGLSKCKPNDHLGAFQYIPRNMRLMYLHAYQSYVFNAMLTKRMELYGLKPVIGDLARLTSDDSIKKSEEKEPIVVITSENIDQFGIEHIVLPLPGHNIVYPENAMMEHYETLLKIDGIAIDNFKNKIKDFSLGGDYRNILVKPKDLSFEILSYNDQNQQVTKSDWDLMQESKEETTPHADPAPESNGPTLKALVLEYSLPSSAYATMALRELLVDELLD